MPGPLDGVRILDCTSVVLGPWAAQQLGDLGADVIKIEPPEGDTTRQLGPRRNPGMAAFYLGCNRSKRSLVLDLKQEAGKQRAVPARRARRRADAQLPARAGGAAGRGLRRFEKINPRLIYLATYGYRAAGPTATRPRTTTSSRPAPGFASLQSVVAGTPRYLPTIVADKTSSNGVVSAVLAALYARERTGVGQAVEVPMFETLASFVMVEHLYGETFVPALETAGYKRILNTQRRPYPTKDGFLAILPYTDGHWREFCALIGRPDLLEEERFTTHRQPARQRRGVLRDAGRDRGHAHQRRVARAPRAIQRAARSGELARRPVHRPAAPGHRLLEGGRSSDRGPAPHARHPAALQQDPARDPPPAAAAGRAQRRGPARGRPSQLRHRGQLAASGATVQPGRLLKKSRCAEPLSAAHRRPYAPGSVASGATPDLHRIPRDWRAWVFRDLRPWRGLFSVRLSVHAAARAPPTLQERQHQLSAARPSGTRRRRLGCRRARRRWSTCDPSRAPGASGCARRRARRPGARRASAPPRRRDRGTAPYPQIADAVRLLRVDVVARQHQLDGLAPADQLREHGGLHARRDAEARLGHAEPGVLAPTGRSAHAATSMPEPKQSPLMRAMTGTGHVRTLSHARWVRVAEASAAARSSGPSRRCPCRPRTIGRPRRRSRRRGARRRGAAPS